GAILLRLDSDQHRVGEVDLAEKRDERRDAELGGRNPYEGAEVLQQAADEGDGEPRAADAEVGQLFERAELKIVTEVARRLVRRRGFLRCHQALSSRSG